MPKTLRFSTRSKLTLVATLAAATLAVPHTGHAAVVTDNLELNWDQGAGMAEDAWTSTSPGSDTTATYNMAEGDGNDPTPVSTTSSTGISQAYQFDGEDDYGTTSATSGFREAEETGDGSVEVWFKPDGLNNGSQFIFEAGGIGEGVSIYLDNATVKVASSGGNDLTLTGPTLTNDDILDFIQVVYTNDTDGVGELYVNTVDATSPGDADDTTGTAPGGLAGDDPGGIGGANGDVGGGGAAPSNGTVFDGQIAINRVYSDVLTGEEVAQNFNAVVPEPASLALLGLGGLMLMTERRRHGRVG